MYKQNSLNIKFMIKFIRNKRKKNFMNNIKILDCTLRDGGYRNNWQFKNSDIISTIKTLQKSKIEIIECGYLSEHNGRSNNSSIFDTLNTANSLIKEVILSQSTEFVLMINYGEYQIKDIPLFLTNNAISGIRIAFHKKDKIKALEFSKQIKNLGFNLYLQPMVISEYSESDIKYLLDEIKNLDCKAVYIVDSLGILTKEEILFLGNLFDNNLTKTTQLGLHLHGCASSVFAKIKNFLKYMNTKRNLILDSSINGVGRGKGNLKTENICDYLNKTYNKQYDITEINKFLLSLNYTGPI